MAGGGRPPARSKGKDKGKTGLIGNILFFGVIVGIGVALVVMFMKPSSHPVLSKQTTPEGAMEAYLAAAYGFQSGQQNFDHIEKAVRKSDYEWFQENYMTMFQSTGMSNIIGPAGDSTVGHIARIDSMKELTSYGPNRLDAEIRSSTVNGNNAEMIVRKKDFYSDGIVVMTDVKVRLTKEGKYWKVVDFAGGRAMVENRAQPGDFVSVDPSTVETTTAAAPQPAMSDPAFAQPAMSDPTFADPLGLGSDPSMGAGMPAPSATPAVVVNVKIKSAPVSPFPGGYAAPSIDQLKTMQSESEGANLIAQASTFWAQRKFQESLDAAEKALVIYQYHLGPRHEKCEQVRQMVSMAQKQIAAAQPQVPNGY